ncbi:hypothetical protein ACHAPA_009158 [Fusarium lateritium]
MEDLPLLSLVGKGFEISVPESAARAHSPVLAAALKNATTTTISVTEFDFPTVQCLAQCLNTGNYGVNANNFPSVSSAVGQQPIPENYTRDLLISHVKVNVVSAYFEIPKLSQLARSHIAPTLEHYWFDSAFLSTVTAALSSKDPYLHRLLVSKARDHLDSLINSLEFDGQTMLRSFHSTFRVSSSTPPSAETDSSVELEKLKKQVSTASSEREKLQQQLTAALSENEELRQRVADVSSDRERLQQRVRDTDTRVAQSVIDLSSTCQLLKQRVKEEENKVSQSTRNFSEASAAQDILQKELKALQEEISDVSSHMHRTEQERRVAEGQATEYAHNLEEKSKAMEAVERDLRVAASERVLLRERWDQEREKVYNLTKSNDDLKLALELKKSFESGQKEATKLTTENSIKAETLVASNKKADAYVVPKVRLANPSMEEQKKTPGFKKNRDEEKQKPVLFKGREKAANDKTTTLWNHDWCVNCGDESPLWTVDDATSGFVMRCSNCPPTL